MPTKKKRDPIAGIPAFMQPWFSPRGGGAVDRDVDLANDLFSQWDKEKLQRDHARRLIAWYMRDRATIEGLIRKQASVTFGDETDSWQIPVINGVYRTVKRLAMTYRTPPERKYRLGDTELKPDSKEMQNIERMFRRVDLTKRMRQMEHWMILGNTAHMEPVYRRGSLDFDFRLRPDVMVVEAPDDYLEIGEFARLVQMAPRGEKPIRGFIYWSDERHLFVREDGYLFAADPDGDGTNPYAEIEWREKDTRIPVNRARKVEGTDYWGRYGSDIVDSFEQAAIQLGNLWENGFLQTHGQPLGINLGWTKEKGGAVKIGPRNPIAIDGAVKDDLPPSLTFASPEPKITEMQELIDWFIKVSNGSYGMPPSSWAIDEKAMSGFAKMIDSEELLEDRQEGLSDHIALERQNFEAAIHVWNRWHPVTSEHVNPEIELDVVFGDVEVMQTPTEEVTTTALEIQNDLSSAVDWVMKKHKISDRQEALKVVINIVKENAEIRKAKMEALGIDPNEPDPNNPGGDPNGDKKENRPFN